MAKRTEVNRIKRLITNSLNIRAGVSETRGRQLLPKVSSTSSLAAFGKLYEVFVLTHMIENLAAHNFTIRLVNGTSLRLKMGGGAINNTFPYFKVFDNKNTHVGDLYTDVYVKSLSNSKLFPGSTSGEYHEIDIALVKPGTINMPEPNQVLLCAECKNRMNLSKSTLREILGFRRELSYYDPSNLSSLGAAWPTTHINANPNSIYMVFSPDASFKFKYKYNCEVWGILLEHLKM